MSRKFTKIVCVVLLVMLVVAGCGGPSVIPGGSSTFSSVAPTHQDLAYADVSSAQKLDLYIPTISSGPFPVVIMAHGGGFMFGDKADGTGHAGSQFETDENLKLVINFLDIYMK